MVRERLAQYERQTRPLIEFFRATSDRVIVNGLQRVRPGVTVDPKLVEMPGATATGQTPETASEERSPSR